MLRYRNKHSRAPQKKGRLFAKLATIAGTRAAAAPKAVVIALFSAAIVVLVIPGGLFSQPATKSPAQTGATGGKLTLPLTATTQKQASLDTKFKSTITSIFWVGEAASRENNYIANQASYWDENWLRSFGGVDEPHHRNGFLPAAFTPKQNPFYVALPFGEVDRSGAMKPIALKIPGFGKIHPLTKGRWVEVRYHGKSCFGQWEDVGPFGEDDFEWVFGEASMPLNTKGIKAGLDVSPAMATCLNLDENNITENVTEWRFVQQDRVPPGPWLQIVSHK